MTDEPLADDLPSEPLANDPLANDRAPRPRPGYRSPKPVSTIDKAQLVAGIVRATLGAVAFFASLLYLPIQVITPILSGVSILMMVTGSTSTWQSVNKEPRAKIIAKLVIGGCVAVALATVGLTLVLGAGSLGPVHAAKEQARRDRPATVSFQPAP